ncbi:MAG: NPCBM/NEW2 domain-containing protein [Tepidisphaerales bacterium]
MKYAFIGIGLLLPLLASAQNKPAPATPTTRPTWPAAMLAARESCQRVIAQQSQPTATFKPFVSELVTADKPMQQVSVNVAGVDKLRLVGICEKDRANCHIWGEAKLIAKDGKEVRLADLKPLVVRVGWGEYLVNENWQQHKLKIGDRTFAHGIWVHADSDVCFDLAGKYERFEAWAGIDADRSVGAARFKVLQGMDDPSAALWAKLSRDFPAECKAFAQDVGNGREREWLSKAADTAIEQSITAKALDTAGLIAQALRGELAALVSAKASPGDVRWLDLYQRTRRCADALGSTASAEPSSFRPAIAQLTKALPDRFAAPETLLQQLAPLEEKWQKVLPAVAKADPESLKQAAELQKQVQDYRRTLLLALNGMKTFLDSWPAVDLVAEWQSQFATLQYDLRHRDRFDKHAPETLRPESRLLKTDRDPLDIVLRRTLALLGEIQRLRPNDSTLADLLRQLQSLQSASATIPVESSTSRFVLFADACRVRRLVAFRNPLLDFDKLLFIKRHRAIYPHMCDQYYGMAQHPGGGVYILSNPFSASLQVRDVLADSVVANGRLKGQKLSGGPLKKWNISFDGMGNLKGEETVGGSFLSPDLSFDGKSIAFAYVECTGDRKHIHHIDPTKGHWAEGRCFHVFRVNVDGSDLRQLTDGTWNDFDPCFLPNGRLAFITERRGGYLRCGRVCPTYTLYDMAADGSDLTGLSPHETNEWHPSVTNDGRIIYTRWDYIDRHGCTAHMPWITTLDGRDSRAVHGNFAPRRERPDMEVNVRAIPNSGKFIATAAPHHNQAFGSLVLVDPDRGDNDSMDSVRRITPDVAFPESQGGYEAYATAWPLSEDFHLCTYSAERAAGKSDADNYGIYLLDSFGNRELIYRDAQIACQSPMPLRPRVAPPAAPALALPANHAPGTGQGSEPTLPTATIAVLNVYDSILPWPANTQIKALRVYQVFPMTVPSGGPPHETGLRVKGAEDSVVPVRHVLGTVPVEADGSAHFTVPANRELFFQAVDERGLAIQSMRSATYLHEGERLVCAGCHEPKNRAPSRPRSTPIATGRGPSTLKPDVDGSSPFSYPRLVQGVLDRNCVDCHREKKAINLARDPIQNKFYASFNSLARKYGFVSYGQDLRTIPGQFGARASKLYAILEKGHYDVKLSPEDLHRLTLWLDSCSMFYGVYEKELGEAQLRGEIVRPTLE